MNRFAKQTQRINAIFGDVEQETFDDVWLVNSR